MAMVPTSPRGLARRRGEESRPLLSGRNRTFLRRLQARERPTPQRHLTAAARPIDLSNKTEARRNRVLRQGWQQAALVYAHDIPELSFAYRFLSNASKRMRYYPALINPDQPDGPPIEVAEYPQVPGELVDSMREAMATLGVGGRVGMSPIQEAMSNGFGIAGEMYLVGREDDDPEWSIKSVEEFLVYDDTYKLREVPLDPAGQLGWQDLDPETTFVARLWQPDYAFGALAWSPMRALLDTSEELMLLSRDVRAIARSRLAGSGILKVPEGLRMLTVLNDSQDPESDEWFGRFGDAMMTPLTTEGTAESVVPIGISGDPESLAQLDHLIIDRPYSALALELRAEAIGRLATGLDLPREILEGIGDVNHWSGAIVSEETFRHHIEPGVITQVDGLAVAFMRRWLDAAGFPKFWVSRACVWYDPVELISKPDPMANAVPLFDRFAINYAALRKAGGFSEKDAPSIPEIYARQLAHLRQFPPNVLEAIIHLMDPSLQIPPIQGGGQIPGMGPKGAVEPPVPAKGGPPTAPPEPAGGSPLPQPPSPPPSPPSAVQGPVGGPQAATRETQTYAADPAPKAAPQPRPRPAGHRLRRPGAAAAKAARRKAAAARDERIRLSRKLAAVDGPLRARLQTAAAASLVRMLDRAGAKLRTRATQGRFKDTPAKALTAGVENRKMAAALGPNLVAALGYADSHALLEPDWGELETQFKTWVRAAQADSVRLAAQLAGIARDDRRARRAAERMAERVDPAWRHLEDGLKALAERLLYHPEPDSDGTAEYDPATIVPQGLIRDALTIAGGGQPRATTAAADPDYEGQGVSVLDPGQTTDVTEPVAPEPQNMDPGYEPAGAMISMGIGNGDAIGDMLGEADMRAEGYTWEHLGVSPHPFEPHLDLDGQTFASFDDDVLANDDDWPPVDYFIPGDHDACGCDWTTEWGPADELGDGEVDTSDEEPGLYAGSFEDGEYVPSEDDPADVADRFGFERRDDAEPSDEDLAAARETLGLVRADIRAQAQQIADDNREFLRSLDVEKNGPHGNLQYIFSSGEARAAEWNGAGDIDWFESLQTTEKNRLRDWMIPRPTSKLETAGGVGYDEVAAKLAELGVEGGQTGNAMGELLDRTRIVDAAQALANGRTINPERYGGLDINSLLDSPYDLNALFARADVAVQEVARVNAAQGFEDAARILGSPRGVAPWEMTEAQYAAEVTAVSQQAAAAVPLFDDAEFGVQYSAADEQAMARLNELIPPAVDAEGASYADLYRTILQVAREGGLI